MAKEVSEKIMKTVEEYLKEEEWYYDVIKDGLIRTNSAIKCKLKKVDIFIRIGDDSFTIDTIVPVGADDNSMASVAEFVTRANYGLRFGCFNLDHGDGEVSYHVAVYCGKETPTNDQIEHGIIMGPLMADRYGDALTKVIYGFATPKDAVEEVENDSADSDS